jgi:hypothetical protein
MDPKTGVYKIKAGNIYPKYGENLISKNKHGPILRYWPYNTRCVHTWKRERTQSMAGMWEQQTKRCNTRPRRARLFLLTVRSKLTASVCSAGMLRPSPLLLLLLLFGSSNDACLYEASNGRMTVTEGQGKIAGLWTQNRTRDFANTKQGVLIIYSDIPCCCCYYYYYYYCQLLFFVQRDVFTKIWWIQFELNVK